MTDATEGEKDNIWDRLRRRKVVQWGVVYVAGAWGLLQGLANVTDTFHWPEQIQQLATLALLIGLPITLVLAWYHGDRGEQRIGRTEFAVLTLLFLAGGGLFWWYDRSSGTLTQTGEGSTPASRTTDTTDARPSVAVLPFDNRSRLADDAFFVDGIHDDILTQLSKVSALKVISRTSVERFRETKLPIKEIADQLGVTKILEGGVQRAGDRVRISVQLIDANSDAHVWAESYDRELTAANIFAIQSEVAAAIAGALKASLTTAERTSVNAIPTQSLDAWEVYQLGKQRMGTRTSAGLAEAEKFFRKAIVLDPTFALAYVGLADTLWLQTSYSGKPREATLAEADRTISKALELDTNLAEALTSAGGIASSRLEFTQSEQLLRRAIALNPNYATAHHWLSTTLVDLGRRDAALASAERAVALDPLSAIINAALGGALQSVGRFDDALVAYQQAIEIDPTMATVYAAIADVNAYAFARFDKSMPWYEKAASLDPGNPDFTAFLPLIHWEIGDDPEAKRLLDRMPMSGEGTAYSNFVAALLYLQRGEVEPARRHAHIAAEQNPYVLFLVRNDDFRKRDYAGARARYAAAFPNLFATELPTLDGDDAFSAIDLALVLQHTGEGERAKALLDRSEAYVRTVPRMGTRGYGIADVSIHALRGDSELALVKLREAERAGWRGLWRYYRDFDPNLASIRDEPEFKAIFADIERDMARQRAELAARPKDALLDLGELR